MVVTEHVLEAKQVKINNNKLLQGGIHVDVHNYIYIDHYCIMIKFIYNFQSI